MANTGEHGSVSRDHTGAITACNVDRGRHRAGLGRAIWGGGVVVCDEDCVVVVGVVRELVAMEVAVNIGVVLVVVLVVGVEATHPRNDPVT